MRTEFQKPSVLIVPLPPPSQGYANRKYIGDGHDILLQGFHWHSHRATSHGDPRGKKSWYRVISENAAAIKAAGFTWVWFPPSSNSLTPQGYIPIRWNVLDTAYGSEAELKAAIQALQPVGALADLVLNHRAGVATAGVDFDQPKFPDNRAAVVRDDESGQGTGNPDTGERYPAGRDLDHTNPDVRATIKTYMRGLKELGFKGWRYDLVKGYHGRFVGEYNDASNPEFSVGECYDCDRQKVTNWVDAAGGKSTAFDFPTRYLLYDACQHDDFGRLRSTNGGRVVAGGLLGFWPTRAVTFVDNHDTEYLRDEEHRHKNDGTRHFPGKLVAMAYAYILTHPGMPCVFWPHFFDWGHDTRQRIEKLLSIRKSAGIHARSSLEIKEATSGLYAAISAGKVAVKLGSRSWSPGPGWQAVVDGEKFAVWTRN
jgi:alpha-amylase